MKISFGLPHGKRAKYSPEQQEDGLPQRIATLNHHCAMEEKRYQRRIGGRTVVLEEEFVSDDSCLSPEDIVINHDLKRQLEKTIRETHLSRRQKQIVELMWRDPDIANRAIAEELGISEKAVSAYKTHLETKIRTTATWRTKITDFLRS